MLGRVFGVIDLLVVVLLLLLHYNIFLGWRIFGLFICYLLLKGFIFFGDWNSWLDISIGFYMLLMVIGLHTFIDWVSIIYMLQKGFISWM